VVALAPAGGPRGVSAVVDSEQCRRRLRILVVDEVQLAGLVVVNGKRRTLVRHLAHLAAPDIERHELTRRADTGVEVVRAAVLRPEAAADIAVEVRAQLAELAATLSDRADIRTTVLHAVLRQVVRRDRKSTRLNSS